MKINILAPLSLSLSLFRSDIPQKKSQKEDRTFGKSLTFRFVENFIPVAGRGRKIPQRIEEIKIQTGGEFSPGEKKKSSVSFVFSSGLSRRRGANHPAFSSVSLEIIARPRFSPPPSSARYLLTRLRALSRCEQLPHLFPIFRRGPRKLACAAS